MQSKETEANLFVIFGGTGDLATRKLLPAIGRLTASDLLGPESHVLGVARNTSHDNASFCRLAWDSLGKAGLTDEQIRQLCKGRLHYQTIDKESPADFEALAHRIDELEKKHNLPGNRAFYLALPPRSFQNTITNLGSAGLHKSRGWTRLVIEKPFGSDLASALELNKLIHGTFREDQIYRIDHYLGKETVQNLLVLRFANPILESLWNRERIARVQITVAEKLGVGARARYYDRSGALRDMVQNHLTQLLTLLAMEVPIDYDAHSIRHEKEKVLRAIDPIDRRDVVLGQYTAGTIDGKKVPGYLEEADVPPDSSTKTYVAMKLGI
ncbi:glucose-6-phosphate dehydrogenase, partial [Candidatus Eisenbacteria bacterium]